MQRDFVVAAFFVPLSVHASEFRATAISKGFSGELPPGMAIL